VASEGCERCEAWRAERRIAEPGDYFAIARELEHAIAQGVLLLLTGSCGLEEIVPGCVWPGDVLIHEIECAACGARYVLSVDTYHGGGTWRSE
jgi:hypothetical protein